VSVPQVRKDRHLHEMLHQAGENPAQVVRYRRPADGPGCRFRVRMSPGGECRIRSPGYGKWHGRDIEIGLPFFRGHAAGIRAPAHGIRLWVSCARGTRVVDEHEAGEEGG